MLQLHFVHHKSHKECPAIKQCLRGEGKFFICSVDVKVREILKFCLGHFCKTLIRRTKTARRVSSELCLVAKITY